MLEEDEISTLSYTVMLLVTTLDRKADNDLLNQYNVWKREPKGYWKCQKSVFAWLTTHFIHLIIPIDGKIKIFMNFKQAFGGLIAMNS